MSVIVHVPYVLGKLSHRVVDAVAGFDHPVLFHQIDPVDPWTYAEFLRLWWREPTDTLVCEHDTVPPPGALEELAGCDEAWCTHPHWVGDRYMLDSLGLAKFHVLLKAMHPDLADLALARPDPRVYTRLGLTNVPADCSEAVLQSAGRRAALRADVVLPRDQAGEPRWPATRPWDTCDMALSRELRHRGFTPHVHQPPTTHLHVYAQEAPTDEE